ncbi:MAG: NAD(P)-dependent oxidoreductase [Hyphomicrobiaceae bacterium]
MAGMTPIGLIGLGNMGLPMARNLAERGFDILAYDARAEATLAATAAHASIKAADGLSAIAQSCRIVITMLPDSKVVDRVVRGASAPDFDATGLALHMAKRSTENGGTRGIIIDMSSSFPIATRALGEALARHGIALVDAPVSGGVRKAIDATLSIMAGCDDDGVFAEIEAPLTAMGRIFRTGGLGSGHATKALNNYLSASSLIATAEAIVIGQRFGLEPKVMNEVFKASTGRSNTTDVKVEQFFIPETYTSGFALALLDKDVRMAREMAEQLGLAPDQLNNVSEHLARGLLALGPEVDHTAMHAFIKQKR